MLRQIISSAFLGILLALAVAAQEPRLPDGAAAVTPRLIKFAGALNDPLGRPMTGVHGVTFALYRDQEGGSPIWLETTTVEFDEQGRFTALLGAVSEQGLTPELFASGEPRWLGAQLQLPGHEEQPRTLLVAVPYALRALDADTVGGLPASAFLRADTLPSLTEPTAAMRGAAGRDFLPPALYLDGGGNANRIVKWLDGDTLTDSIVAESGNNIQIGLTSSGGILAMNRHLALTQGANSDQVSINWIAKDDNNNGVFDGNDKGWHLTARSNTWGIPSEQNDLMLFRFDGGQWVAPLMVDFPTLNIGIGTAQPTAKLDVGGGFSVAAFRGNSTDAVVTVQNIAAGGTSWDIAATANGSSAGAGKFVIAKTGVAHHFTIIDNGNVGIGTTVPANKLEVAGNIKITSGGLIFPDGTMQTTAAGSLAFGGRTATARESATDTHSEFRAQIERLQAEVEWLKARVEALSSGTLIGERTRK